MHARSPCADKSRGSRPAAAHRRLTIRLIYCGARAVKGAKRAAFRNVGSLQPLPERRDRQHLTVVGGDHSLVATEPDGETGQGGGIRGRAIEGNRGLPLNLHCSQPRNVAVPPAAGGEGDGQDGGAARVDQTVGGASR